MRQLKYILMVIASLSLLTACSDGEPSVVGTWEQTDPYVLNQSGVATTVSDSTADFRADGTTRGEGLITLSGTAIPDGEQVFRITTDGTWSVSDSLLTRRMETVRVESQSGTPDGLMMAKGFEQDFLANPVDTFEISRLDKNFLELANTNTGIPTLFEKR